MLRQLGPILDTARRSVSAYAAQFAPHVDPAFVSAMVRALGDISVQEAYTALLDEEAVVMGRASRCPKCLRVLYTHQSCKCS